jgi:hypothetical protein
MYLRPENHPLCGDFEIAAAKEGKQGPNKYVYRCRGCGKACPTRFSLERIVDIQEWQFEHLQEAANAHFRIK